MKILIADDEHGKIIAASRYLMEECELLDSQISTATTSEDVKMLLRKEHFDILLLDIIFPLNNVSEPAAETSVQLVIGIETRVVYHKTTRIIGFTAFAGIPENTLNEFAKRSWTVIKYSSSSND